MSNTSKLIMKEVKELLTPATLIPIIILAVVFGSLGSAISGSTSVLSEKPTLGIINQGDGPLSHLVNDELAKQSKIVYNQSDIIAGISAVKENGGVCLIVINSTFDSNIASNRSGSISVYWIMRGAGIADSLKTAPVELILAQTSQKLSRHLIDQSLSSNSSVILQPFTRSESTDFKGKLMLGINPGTIASVISNQGIIMPLIVMMVIIYGGSMVISSMGNEKENKTLETLLTLPVSRNSIVMGKLVGATIVGLIMAVIYMIGMGYYMTSFTLSAPVDLAKYGLSLDLPKYLLVGVSLFLALMCALALCLILGIFTKNYKAAQSMTLPITMLALIPMFVLMFTDFDSLPTIGQALIFAIPFSQPTIAARALMFDDYTIVIAGIVYNAIFGLVTMFIAVKLFKMDILLTGRVKSAEQKRRYSLFSLNLPSRSRRKK
jgi:ABC-2 type transport system permease protein